MKVLIEVDSNQINVSVLEQCQPNESAGKQLNGIEYYTIQGSVIGNSADDGSVECAIAYLRNVLAHRPRGEVSV